MMAMDQWDWKTSAPEFVPGLTTDGGSAAMTGALHPSMYAGGFSGGFPMPMSPATFAGATTAVVTPLPGGSVPPFDGGPGSLGSMAAFHAGNTAAYGPGPIPGQPPGPGAAPLLMEEAQIAAHLRAQYEWQIQTKDQKLWDLQNRLTHEEMARIQMQDDFERDRQGLMRHLNHLAAAVERYGIPLDEPKGFGMNGADNGDHEMRVLRGPFEPNLEQSRGSVRECQESQRGIRGKGSLASSRNGFGRILGGIMEDSSKPSEPQGKGSRGVLRSDSRSSKTGDLAFDRPGEFGSGSRARSRKPRVTFPDEVLEEVDEEAAVREEIDKAIMVLERRTGGAIDPHARLALDSLSYEGAREALAKVEDLIQGQGGRCANLSSVLQSVCRKIRRRGASSSESRQRHPTSSRRAALGADGGGGSGGYPGSARSRRRSTEAALLEDEEGPFGEDPRCHRSLFQGGSSSSGSMKGIGDYRGNSSGCSFGEEVRSSDLARGEGDRHGAGERGSTVRCSRKWSTARFERLSRQGAFDLRKAEDGLWDLRIWMSELDPPLNDEGMQVYCRWLHKGLASLREECKLWSLRQIRAEVNFSKNGLSDDAVGRLLQALQRSELHVTSLNLFANNLGPAGTYHICDFLRSASFPVNEVHLSHNQIDDASALELLRVFAEHPRYPLRRAVQRGGAETWVPVWLRLNNNLIVDPVRVLRQAEAECGVTVSVSHDSHMVYAPAKSGWRGSGMPLVHMLHFSLQDRCAKDSGPTNKLRRRNFHEGTANKAPAETMAKGPRAVRAAAAAAEAARGLPSPSVAASSLALIAARRNARSTAMAVADGACRVHDSGDAASRVVLEDDGDEDEQVLHGLVGVRGHREECRAPDSNSLGGSATTSSMVSAGSCGSGSDNDRDAAAKAVAQRHPATEQAGLAVP